MIRVAVRFFGFLLQVVLAACACAALADEYPASAILRIESGAHTAPIRSISADAAGRIAVTASEDKTARVWELPSGRLLNVLRPPIGTGSEGSLYASAITPDSEVIAVGGWSKDNDVYLFARGSGQLIHRITGLPNVITHLAFSPAGNSLLINMWGKNGIRLFASSDNWRNSREVAGDSEYEGESYGADFSRDGKRVVTTSFDGLVRLYDATDGRLRLLKSARVIGGTQPFTAVFSSDQSKIALSFSDTSAVAVLEADSLRQAYSPDVSGISQGNLSALTWSHDGSQLIAAGSWKRADAQHGLRRWTDAGRGAFADSTIAGNSVTGLSSLADGRILFAASDPAWGVIDGGKDPQTMSRAGLVDYRGNDSAFALAHDGSAVGFAYALGKAEAGGFDITGMASAAKSPKWTAALTSAKGIALERWFESARPTLNKQPLRLAPNEVAFSVAINSGNTHFALGSNFNVRYFNRSGVEQWHTSAPGTTWHVNLSRDGRWLVAGFSDGTIRWYRTRDGVEQLAFLPHADRKRWVMWTPQGYYAASVGGEDLIGWHINNGAQRAGDFFPGSRLRATFYRPDVIAQVIVKGDVDSALEAASDVRQALGEIEERREEKKDEKFADEKPVKVAAKTKTSKQDVKPDARVAVKVDTKADTKVAAKTDAPATKPAVQKADPAKKPAVKIEQRLPPVVTVLSPNDGSSIASRDLKLNLSVRAAADAPISSLRVRVNGQIVDIPENRSVPVATTRNGGEAQYQLRFSVPSQDSEVMVFAENQFGFSTPAVLRLRWTGADGDAKKNAGKPAPAPTPAAKPDTGKVPPGTPDTRPALYVLAVGVSKYRNAAIQLDYAAKDAGDFVASLKQQQGVLYRKVVVKLLTDDRAKRDDVLDGLEWIRREMTNRDVGMIFLAGHGVNDSDGIFYYLPQDVDVDKLKRTGVIFTEIKNTLATLPGKALFFVDTCHAGNVLGTGRRAIPNDITAVVNELTSAENGVIVFAAATGRQFAQESATWRNGVFTLSLIEGIGGKADNARSGRVTHKMLDLYTSERVKALTKGAQSPVTIVPQGIPDFPLAISR